MQQTFTGYLHDGIKIEDIITEDCFQMGCANTVQGLFAGEHAFPMLTDVDEARSGIGNNKLTRVKITVKLESIDVSN